MEHFFNRDQWKGYVAPYHPVFLDGWSPDYPVGDDRDHMSSAIGVGVNTTTAAAVTTEGTRTRGEDVSRKFYVQDWNSFHEQDDMNTAFYCINLPVKEGMFFNVHF
jgi:hypothetical protein